MSANAKELRRTSRLHLQQVGPTIIRPVRVAGLRDAVVADSRYLPPFRPMGAGIAATECTTSSAGTVIDMTGLNEIKNIDAYADTVTVQAGVRIGDLACELAEHGLELAGGHDIMSRTVGGAIAGACIGPSFGGDGAFFASQVRSLRVISPNGKPLEIRRDQPNLLNAFRMSFGMLGTIYEATLNVRPMQPFSVNHRRCNFDQFSEAAEKLGRVDVGLKFYLLPFRDRVYLDLRRYSQSAKTGHRIPWKIKDWGESTVLPNVFKSLNRLVPVAGVRYRLIDEISQMTQGLVNNRLVTSGCNATAQISSAKDDDSSRDLYYSTWFFPAADFAVVVQAYSEFSQRIREETGFRCDMPTVGYFLSRDRSAILSPCFDEPMIALRAVSTESKGWDDFAIDFGEFARHWGASPLFNQSRELDPGYAKEVLRTRLDYFRKVRRQVDPDNRMMNPFLSQYFL